MMRKLVLILCVGGIFAGSASFAASPFKRALPKKLDSYLDEGVVIGGRSGRTFSLLNVRRDLSPKLGMERIILDMGDGNGRPLKGGVSYFQASVEKDPPRVVIDLAQTVRSGITDTKLRAIFKHSPFIKKVDLTADPEDSSATLVLGLKTAMDVEVFEMPAKDRASRIVIDLKKKTQSTARVKAKK